MSRMIGTVSRGLRAPIIREGENLAQIVVDCIMQAVAQWASSPTNSTEQHRRGDSRIARCGVM